MFFSKDNSKPCLKFSLQPKCFYINHENVINLYQPLPIDKAIDITLQQLSKDYEDLKRRTKLKLIDIQQLTELCTCKCYFLWDVIWDLVLDSQLSIGLSLIIVLSVGYLQNIKKHDIELALTFGICTWNISPIRWWSPCPIWKYNKRYLIFECS